MVGSCTHYTRELEKTPPPTSRANRSTLKRGAGGAFRACGGVRGRAGSVIGLTIHSPAVCASLLHSINHAHVSHMSSCLPVVESTAGRILEHLHNHATPRTSHFVVAKRHREMHDIHTVTDEYLESTFAFHCGGPLTSWPHLQRR